MTKKKKKQSRATKPKTKKKVVKKKVVKKPVKKKKKIVKKVVKKKNVFTWYLPFLILLILIISFSSFLGFLFSKNYKDWEKEFLNSDVLLVKFEEIDVDLDEKILEYNRGRDEYSFIEFSREEALYVFSESLDNSLPDWVSIEQVGLSTVRGEWDLYIKTRAWNLNLPWFRISLLKDNLQSVDIYIDDIYIGDFSFRNFFLTSVVEKSNSGLQRAIQLINDGNFAGRVFENIELGEESLVIKSRNISF